MNSSANNTTTTTTSSSFPINYRSCFRSDLFVNKVALVTGGGTGLGKAIATELALTGASTVVIASRRKETCQETANEINQMLMKNARADNTGAATAASTSNTVVVVAGPSTNIRDAKQVHELIAWILAQYKRLDLVVNNAGGQFISPAAMLSPRGFMAVVETNLLGTFLVCKEAYDQYMSTHGGSIVNITLGNRNGMPGMMHSGAARAGIENMTKTLCTEWMESGIRINCVRPGIIFTDSGFENYGEAGDEFVKKLLPSIPAKRFGSPEEVSSAVCWLLSEGASYVTGTVICVDGANSFTFLPLIDIEDKEHLPVYGSLSNRARL